MTWNVTDLECPLPVMYEQPVTLIPNDDEVNVHNCNI